MRELQEQDQTRILRKLKTEKGWNQDETETTQLRKKPCSYELKDLVGHLQHQTGSRDNLTLLIKNQD